MTSRRDELAEKHVTATENNIYKCVVTDWKATRNGFKAGWDACEKELSGSTSYQGDSTNQQTLLIQSLEAEVVILKAKIKELEKC